MTRGLAPVALALALAGSDARAQVSVTLPAQPWPRVRHVSVPGACSGPLVPRPGGGAAATLSSPSGFALIGRDGAVVRAWRVDFRVDEAWWVGRDALHALRGRNLLVAHGADGTLRGSHLIADTPLGHLAGPDAEESTLTFGSATATLATRVGWDATPIESITSGGGWRPATSGPAGDGRGGVWVGAGAGLVRILPTRRNVPLDRGIRRLATRAGGGLFALVEGALIALDHEANVLGRSAIDATVVDLVSRADGGVAALVQTAPPRVVLFDARAAPRARFDAGTDARALTAGDDGATLVASRDGTLAAHEPDGALRWRMSLPGPLRPPVVPLSSGRCAVATERGEIIVLELAEPGEPR